MVPIDDAHAPGRQGSPPLPVTLSLDLDPCSATPLFRQIYEGIRSSILDGRLHPGERLPATRRMAEELGVSRNTALAAFDQLLSEGYLEGRTGAGTFVTQHLPEHLLQALPSPDLACSTRMENRRISERGHAVANARVAPPTRWDVTLPFQLRGPSIESFPFDIWERITVRHFRTLSRTRFTYGEPAGYWPLREAIASYLRTARAVRCDADRVIIVSGAQQALTLASQILIDPGDRVLVEDPGYLGTRGALSVAGARVVPVPVDEEGIRIDIGAARAPDARLLCVTPSHQYPLGVRTSLTRRLQLLDWAARSDAWILEDDYDSEYRYAGRPISSLQGLDNGNRVIYVGTFSKVLFPSLRLGYMVVPPDLVEAVTAARAAADRHGPIIESAVTATFIEEGHFARHIRRMRVLYKERQEAMVEIARQELGGLLEINPSDAGMHLIGWLPEGSDDHAVAERAIAAGVMVQPLSAYTMQETLPPGLLLGYTPFDERTIRRGIQALAEALA